MEPTRLNGAAGSDPLRAEQKNAADMLCLGTRAVNSGNCLIDFRRDMQSRRREFFLNVQVSTVRKAKAVGGQGVIPMVQNDSARRGHSSPGGEEIWSRLRNWRNVGQAWRLRFTSFSERFVDILENFLRGAVR